MAFPTNLSNDRSETKSPIDALNTMLFHVPLTDETKIQFLKEELSAGRYQIQSHSLAAKLIEHVHPVQELEMA